MKKIIFATLALFIIIIGILAFDIGRKDGAKPINFKECVIRGFPIQESFPRRCVTPEGDAFDEKIGNSAEDKSNLIKVSAPSPDEIIKSPLTVSGSARGYWFFEASFPVRLEDDAGKEISSGIAKAKGDWMTSEFVPFEAALDFEKPSAKTGRLILKKDNPSGLPQNDNEIVVPVRFE